MNYFVSIGLKLLLSQTLHSENSACWEVNVCAFPCGRACPKGLFQLEFLTQNACAMQEVSNLTASETAVISELIKKGQAAAAAHGTGGKACLPAAMSPSHALQQCRAQQDPDCVLHEYRAMSIDSF